MLCPFCLKENTIKKIDEKGRSYYICSEHPEPRIPIIYAENEKNPREIISAIGFRGNGKSAYFASLFSNLDALASPNVWPRFSYNPVDDHGLTIVHQNMKLLKKGILPQATPKNFPIPTIVQFSDMPKFKDRFLIFYDTSGESFEKASDLGTYANFVTRSQTAIFFMSLHDLEYNPQEMLRLLHVYIIGLKELGGNPKLQHLLVVLTKGDLLASKLKTHHEIWDYLINGDVKNLRYADINAQITEMKKISKLLKEFLRDDISAAGFLSLGEKNFRTVEICITSALGAAPNGDQLDITSTPKRIFDPILWVMNNSSGWRAFFFKVINSLYIFVNNTVKNLKNRIASSERTHTKRRPINYRKAVKYSAILLILIVAIYVLLFSQIQIADTLPQITTSTLFSAIPAITTTPNNQITAKDLALRTYGDYLQQGQSNTYYFDVDNSNEKIKVIKVIAKAASGNKIIATAGYNYVPSIENQKYDYVSSSGIGLYSSDNVIEIYNPKSGRYFVTVKGLQGSGDTQVSRAFY